MEAENTSEACQLKIGRAEINNHPAYSEPVSVDRVNVNKHWGFQQNCRAATCSQFSRPFNSHQPSVTPPSAPCTYCCPPQANTHTILNCFKLENDKRVLTINSAAIIEHGKDESNDYLYPKYDHNIPDSEEEEEEQKPQYQNKQYQHYNSVSVVACHILNTAQQNQYVSHLKK